MNDDTTDFTTLSHAEIAEFAVAHRSELDCEDMTVDEIISKLSEPRTILEVRPYGFAVIEPSWYSGEDFHPFLWLLFVHVEKRGNGLGHKFMREILSKYAKSTHMRLKCFGARRRKFFGRLGFIVESREDDKRTMTTDPNRGASEIVIGKRARR